MINEDQKQHLEGIVKEFTVLCAAKYKKGAEEHGGNLWDMSASGLLDNALDEAIDQVVYLLTLKQKLEQNEI